MYGHKAIEEIKPPANVLSFPSPLPLIPPPRGAEETDASFEKI